MLQWNPSNSSARCVIRKRIHCTPLTHSYMFTYKQGNDTTLDYMQTIKLKSDVVSTQYGHGWLISVHKDALIKYCPATKWSGATYADCFDAHQTLLDTHVKDILIVAIGVSGCSMKIPEGGTLKAFLKAHSAASNIVATCYPSGTSYHTSPPGTFRNDDTYHETMGAVGFQ